MLPSALIPRAGRFLHIIPDDKFIDGARSIFEQAMPDAHDFIIIRPAKELTRIRTFQPLQFELHDILNSSFLRDLKKYSAVFIHFLNDSARLLVSHATNGINFIWLGWGADYYHLIRPPNQLLLPLTHELLKENKKKIISFQSHILKNSLTYATRHPTRALKRLIFHCELYRYGRNRRSEFEIINKFKLMATPIIEDYESIKNRHKDFATKFLDWSYWSEGFFSDQLPRKPTNNSILLGNSATPENNHLDALEILSKSKIEDRNIICPLSYGDPKYAEAVIKRGELLFGTRFTPLHQFMEPAIYSRTIASCSVVIMNHIRQQALGNIIIGICSGAHVFLHKDNPINKAMSRIGIETRNIAEISSPSYLENLAPHPDTKLDDIRSKVEASYGYASILNRTRQLLIYLT